MKRLRTIGLLLPTAVLLVLAGCGKNDDKKRPVNLSVQALGTENAVALSSYLFGFNATSSSANKPIVDGMKVTFAGDIVFCVGVYATPTGSCNQVLYTFSTPVEVDLTGDIDDQLNISAETEMDTGTYTHAQINFQQQGAIKAYYVDGGSVIYTTAAGVMSQVGTTPPEDYGYLVIDKLYNVQIESGANFQETTYFDKPFVYDGASALDVKLHVDLLRTGYFEQDPYSWNQQYLAMYMTFGEDAVVETYELQEVNPDPADLGKSKYLTIVLNSSNEMIGGRSRGDDRPSIQQFLKDWSCSSSNVCDFKVGDHGTPDDPVRGFVQKTENFKRLSVGQSDQFLIENTVDPSLNITIDYTRIR